MNSHPPIIIFDVDGPLVDAKGHLIAARELFHDNWFEWNETEKKNYTAMEMLRRFEASDAPRIKQFLKNINTNFRKILPNRVKRWFYFGALGKRIRPYEYKYSNFIPGVVEVIYSLHSQGYIIGICSSSETKRIKIWLKKGKLENIIHCITSRDHRKKYGLKPSKGPILGLLCIMKHYYHFPKIERDRIVFIGDNVTDIQAAHNARIKSIGVLSGHGFRKELESARPNFILNSAAELPSILDKLFPE